MGLRQFARKSQLRPRLRQAVAQARWRLRHLLPLRPHGRDRTLIITLTSYAARFPTLHLTLRCLLTQSVRPDRVILWLGPDDLRQLPPAVRALEPEGLEIRETEDLRSYTKIIPALKAFPEAILVTADDDVHYERHWLRALLAAWSGKTDQIVCHRAHRFTLREDGTVAPYESWPHDIRHEPRPDLIFPTGVGGVLYPPGALAPEVTDTARFLELAPRADDLWLYWMGRRAGSHYRLVKRRQKLVVWPNSQGRSLYAGNAQAGNDTQIAPLVACYGLPAPAARGARG